MAIRNSAKAVIIQDGKVLAIQCRSWKNEIYHILPGGGQEPGETLPEALIRECREEIGAGVVVHDLRWIREYLGKNHEFADKHADVHAMEFMFNCTLEPNAVLALGHIPDDGQVGISWLPLDRLEEALFFPKILQRLLREPQQTSPIYLGDVN